MDSRVWVEQESIAAQRRSPVGVMRDGLAGQ